MKFHARTLVGSLFGIFMWSVQAQTAAPFSSAAQAPASNSSVWGSAWLGLITLSMLVVLVALVIWLYRRGTQGTATGGQIQLLAAFPVGPRERLLVVRMGDRIVALGHTPSQITYLTELESFEPTLGNSVLTSGFAGQLQSLLSGKSGK
jgi:flagellar protein FliO/FliZ